MTEFHFPAYYEHYYNLAPTQPNAVLLSNFVGWVRTAELLFLISLLYLGKYKLSSEITYCISDTGNEICRPFWFTQFPEHTHVSASLYKVPVFLLLFLLSVRLKETWLLER